ncbi:MAG: anti-sigma regulatory factor [Deltaproteobacteria bacterium]|nr:anti-sigma regulatory factor [Deltaproteobacteria bacterium]
MTPGGTGQVEVSIRNDADVILARKEARDLARALGFGMLDQTRVVTAVSELARNVVVHAGQGTVFISGLEGKGLRVVFRDKGPGIPDIEEAMREGYSTVDSLGLGLSGARKLVDSLEVDSRPGEGTTVTLEKRL